MTVLTLHSLDAFTRWVVEQAALNETSGRSLRVGADGPGVSLSADVDHPPPDPPALLPRKPFWCPNCLHHYADAACDGCGRILTLAAGRRAPSLCRSDAPQISIPQTNGPALTPENAGDGPSTTRG